MFQKQHPEDAQLVIGPSVPSSKPPTTTIKPRAPNLHSDFETPLRQAMVPAVCVGIAGLLILYIARIQGDVNEIMRYVAWDMLFALATLVIFYLWRIGVIDTTLEEVEEVIHVDLNRDGRIGRETGAVFNGKVKALSMAELTEMMLEMIYLEGQTDMSTVRAMIPELSREQYVDIRNKLIRAGVARQRGTTMNAGWVLLPKSCDDAKALASQRIIWTGPKSK